MYIQFTVFCLFAMAVVATADKLGGCLFEPCRQHLGVYYLVITLTPNLTLYEVVTFHSDGTFNTIDSLADGNLFSSTPPFGAYSNLNGIWECNGRNKITANVLEFNYPTQQIPRYVSTALYNFVFDGNDRVTGTVANNDYNLASTQNPDHSKWIKLAGPFQYNFQGYKLFKRCGN
jgi:hypothetical protein